MFSGVEGSRIYRLRLALGVDGRPEGLRAHDRDVFPKNVAQPPEGAGRVQLRKLRQRTSILPPQLQPDSGRWRLKTSNFPRI